jgi:hypothetical protein
LKDTCIIILNEDKAVYMIVEKVAFKYVEGVTFSTKILQEFIGSIIVCDNKYPWITTVKIPSREICRFRFKATG